jgi:transcriptional regulator with XRE-family HTH domain
MMKERIKEFIDYKGISPGELASQLEVQRSNISHILNGRNKPGASLIEKMLMIFPDLDARWLLTGEGEMLAHGNVSKSTGVHSTQEQSNEAVANIAAVRKDKQVDKVVLLYNDGTFVSYDK